MRFTPLLVIGLTQQPTWMLSYSQILNLTNIWCIYKNKRSKTLGAIKHILKQAPQEGRLLAYTSLCRPILEYACTVWDPTLTKDIESLKMLQHRAIRFIERLRRRETVTEACVELGLQPLKQTLKSEIISSDENLTE